jgi:hypothetical protein
MNNFGTEVTYLKSFPSPIIILDSNCSQKALAIQSIKSTKTTFIYFKVTTVAGSSYSAYLSLNSVSVK